MAFFRWVFLLLTLMPTPPSSPPPHTGHDCEQVDSCVSNPCANGGTCAVQPSGAYSCTCPSGWEGPHCENDTDECADATSSSSPVCHNKGLCINTLGSYQCNCPQGFTGRHCETPYQPCSPSPCLNQGTCRPTSDFNYQCHCLPGEKQERTEKKKGNWQRDLKGGKERGSLACKGEMIYVHMSLEK